MAQDGGNVVSLTHRPLLPPGNTPGTHFARNMQRIEINIHEILWVKLIMYNDRVPMYFYIFRELINIYAKVTKSIKLIG